MKIKILIVSLLLAVSTHAAQFTAAYLFDDGVGVAMGFTATRNGNYVTDISGVTLFVFGIPWEDTSGLHYPTSISSTFAPTATMTMDGSFMDFTFATENVHDNPDWWDDNALFQISTHYGEATLYHYQTGAEGEYFPENWTIFQTSADPDPSPTVPDAGSSALMLAMGLAVAFAVKRHRPC